MGRGSATSGRTTSRLDLPEGDEVLDVGLEHRTLLPPGLTYAERTALLRPGRIAGLDIAIYDPDLDPAGQYGPEIFAAIAAAFDSAGG